MTDAIVSMLNRSDPISLVALVLIFGGSILVGLTAIITGFVFAFRKSEMEISFKREMVARGMSADEIERVLSARPNHKPADQPPA